jgi:hypothetical protein
MVGSVQFKAEPMKMLLSESPPTEVKLDGSIVFLTADTMRCGIDVRILCGATALVQPLRC